MKIGTVTFSELLEIVQESFELYDRYSEIAEGGPDQRDDTGRWTSETYNYFATTMWFYPVYETLL